MNPTAATPLRRRVGVHGEVSLEIFIVKPLEVLLTAGRTKVNGANKQTTIAMPETLEWQTLDADRGYQGITPW